MGSGELMWGVLGRVMIEYKYIRGVTLWLGVAYTVEFTLYTVNSVNSV